MFNFLESILWFTDDLTQGMSRITLIKYAAAVYAFACLLFIFWAFSAKRCLRLVSFLSASLFFLAALYVYAFHIEPNWIQVHKLVIRDPELTPVVQGLRIIHITDVHITKGIGAREKQLIQKINALKPDLVFFTGDLIDDISLVPAGQQFLKSLHPTIGIFGVPGNTDHTVMSASQFSRVFAPSGLETLLNRSRPVALPNGHTLWLLGVDDPKYGFANLRKTVAGVPSGEPLILLAHSPEIFDDAVRDRINLVLAGDTHGGQVGIPWLVRLSRYANRGRYIKGFFKRGKTSMYINNGIGTKSLNVRFLCPPEIVVLDVRS